MTRKTTLLLIFALTLITLFGSFSTAGASGSVAAEGVGELPQVASSTESGEPEIEDIEPDEGKQGQTLDVLITGENTHFNAASEVSFSPPDGITITSDITVTSATTLTMTITIADDAPVGKRDVTVTTIITDGVTEVITKEHGFEVEAADEPKIKAIEPNKGKPGQTLDVAITGKNTHFDPSTSSSSADPLTETPQEKTPTEKPADISAATFAPSNVATGTAVSFSPPDGITVNSTTVHDATSLTVNITIGADAEAGKRDVTVTTVITDGVTEVVTKTNGFKVKKADDDDDDKVKFEGTIISVTVPPGSDPITGTITVETEDDEDDGESLAAVTATTWTVHINADTRIRIGHGHGEGTIADLAVGQQVEVEGILQDDGSVLARKIHVEHDDDDDDRVGFRGTIEAKYEVTTTLTVQMGPRTLTVVTDENTKIEDADDEPITFADLEVGQQIKGKGVLQEDGSILASEIEVEEDHDGPGHGWVRFEGEITDLPDAGLIGEWTVGTTTFRVDENTKIKPPGFRPEVGDWAKVTAARQEGDTLLALKVHLKKHEDRPPRPVEFHGTIEAMDTERYPPAWIVVHGREVLIDDLTRIEGVLVVGAHVEVRGFLQNDGSVLATRIEVEDDDDDEDEVEFKGRIQRIEDGMWVVGGFTVLIITDTTTITGATPQVGLLAEVKGARVGPQTVRATKIEVEDPSDGNEQVKVRGIIASLPGNVDPDDHTGTWTIITEEGDSVLIEVTSDTVIDTEHGEVEEGALVRVTALRQEDGTLVAQRIKVFESD